MTKCGIDDKSLKLIQSKTALVLRTYLKNKESMSTLKVNMLNLLNKIAQQYELTNITDIVNTIYNTSIRYGVVDLNPDFFSTLNITNLLTAQLEGIQVNNTLETSADNLTNTELVRLRVDASRDFLDNAYGIAIEVSDYVLKETNKNLFDCIFINRGSIPNQRLGVVQNNTEVNNNLREYLEILLRRITNYLSLIVKNAPNLHTSKDVKLLLANPHLYQEVDGEIKNTGILELILLLANMYLSPNNFNSDVLRLLFNDMNDITLSLLDRDSAKLKLEAYNAKVILDHFDTYLSIILNKKIQIKDFNLKTGEDKYQISKKTAKLVTTWRVSDNIFVEDEADMITQIAINTTPFIRWQLTTPSNGRFIRFLDFEYILAKIKNLVYKEDISNIIFDSEFIENNLSLWDSLSDDTKAFLANKKLTTAINIIRRNPRLYLSSIFEILTNLDFYDLYINTLYKDFTNDELNKLYSISRGIFNGSNSIYELAGHNTLNDYYSYITETADAIFRVNYLQYYKDYDGTIKVRTLIDLSINNIKRSLELTINSANNKRLIRDYNLRKKELNLISNSIENFQAITFIIPNTNVKVNVVASSGSVYFYDNTSGLLITNYMLLWLNDNIKLFIDDILHLNITFDTNFLEELYNVEKQWSILSKDLLSFASRVILNQYVAIDILKDKSILEKEALINSIYGRNAPEYDYALDTLGLIHGNDVRTLTNIATAKANLYGITTSAQVKDGLGKSLSTYTLSRLLGSLQSQFELQERLRQSASKDFILLTIPGLYEGVYTVKEFYNSDGSNKEATSMNVSEMSYAGLIQDFVKGLTYEEGNLDLVGNYHVLFLSSVNSDKSTISKIRINLNKVVNINGLQKDIKDLNSSELELLIANEFGNFYINIYNNIINDWRIFDEYLHEQRINIPINLASDYINGFENFNKYFFTHIKELSLYGNNPINFIKYFVLKYNKSHRLYPLEIIDLVYCKSNKGNLAINETLLAQIARFKPEYIENINSDLLQKYPTSRLFWNIKKSEILKDLLKSNFKVNTSNVNLSELQYIRNQFPTWINSSGDLVLAKATINGNNVNITSERDLIKIGMSRSDIDNLINSLILNPLIELYNYLEYLFTQEFMNSSVGSFIAHPIKGKVNNVLEAEAAQFLALHKRNVSLTAAMHPFQLNLLNGIPEDYNVAIIDDIQDKLVTINGRLNDIKPFDGATFVNPFVVILENNSLGGARVGITKKQFIHFKNERTGTSGIIKTAGFGLTNDWLRNSPFLQRMMRKMTDHVWLNKDGLPTIIDITRDYKGNLINYLDFFFKQNNKFYLIIKIDSLGNNMYLRHIQEVTADGNPKGSVIIEQPITINTNYKLWNFFGGSNSMVMDGRFLKLSNTSVENVVEAMNSVGLVIGNPSQIRTLDQLWLPLKMSDIYYVATAGAVKQGGANINSVDKYLTDITAENADLDNSDLDIMRIKMYLSGVQLDKEHHADLAELSLMTLVVSACASKGYTFEAASRLYDALRKATDVNLKDYFQSLRQLFTDGSEQSLLQFLNVLFESIINSLGAKSSANRNFALIIASDLIRQAKEGKKIKFSEVLLPLSDNTVYAKIASTVASYLTNTGIRQKIPGVLAVLSPSHEIYKLYAGRKYESFTNPELELAELLAQLIPIYDSLYQYSPDMLEFAGMQILYVPENSLTSSIDNLPVAARNPHDGTILIDDALLRLKYELKAWKKLRNSKPLERDFTSYDDWKKFVLLHEAMHSIYPKLENESQFDYETRINELALRRFDNNISNLELGRTYFVTRNVPIDIETDEGTIETFESRTEKKLIRTPREYLELKNAIIAGEVTSVVEDIVDGRNLAGYNVRFSSDTGERFLLWDLDSASALFDLNELKERLTGSELDINDLYNLYQKIYGVSPNISTDNLPSYMLSLEIRLRRLLLNDLENLSYTTQDTLKLYQTFLSTRENTRQWYNKYALWINIKLGRGHGSLLYLGGKFVQIDDSNFEEVQNRVAKILDNTTKVKIGGVYRNINKSSIVTLAYEVIMPKIFASNFGLKEFDDLETIRNDPDFFVKQYLENLATKVTTNQYTVELKKSNGLHYYLLTKKQALTSGLTTKIEPLTVVLDNKIYRLDVNGNILYEIEPDTEIYQDSLGNEIIVSDNLEFYINNLSFDSVKLSDRLINYPSLVRNIAEILRVSTNKVATSYYRYITSQGNQPLDIMYMNREYHSLTLDNYQTASPTHPVIRQGRRKHTSFLKSLDIIAARIPAQSMQSYMPMKVVAYENPDINNVYVSTYLILLLGSDYDIDTASLATYDIDDAGILLLWSPYSQIDSIDLMNASMLLPLPTGIETKILESNDLTNPLLFLNKYRNILSINESMVYNRETKQYEVNPSNIELNLMLNTPEQIILFKLFLEDIRLLTKLPSNSIALLLNFASQLMNSELVTFKFRNPQLINAIFNKLEDIVNRHNLYLDRLSRYRLDKIINNYTMYNMYSTIIDPVNLILAQTSVDGTTDPLKNVANLSASSKDIKFRTPGNAINKFEGIVDNQVGKLSVGICAIGLKGFFGLTLYYNYLLNNGTESDLSRLLLNSNHQGYIINGKTYKLLANIRSKDPNTITNDDVLEALASVTNDNDSAIILSALLSLATDFRILVKNLRKLV